MKSKLILMGLVFVLLSCFANAFEVDILSPDNNTYVKDIDYLSVVFNTTMVGGVCEMYVNDSTSTTIKSYNVNGTASSYTGVSAICDKNSDINDNDYNSKGSPISDSCVFYMDFNKDNNFTSYLRVFNGSNKASYVDLLLPSDCRDAYSNIYNIEVDVNLGAFPKWDYAISCYNGTQYNLIDTISTSNIYEIRIANLETIIITSCFQEQANESTAGDGYCGLNYSGSYAWKGCLPADYLEGADADYSTAWRENCAGANFTYQYINYTKPIGFDYAIWQIKAQTWSINNTIPIPDSCFNYDPNKLILRVHTELDGADRIEPMCYNGSWVELTNIFEGGYLTEEAMYWLTDINKTINITNLDEDTYDYYVYCYDSTTNATSETRTYVIDSSDPIKSNSNLANQVMFNTPMNYSFTIDDEHLFSYNVEVWDGSSYISYTNDTNIVGTQANVSFVIDPKNFTPGLYHFNVTYADGHTAKQIDDYDVKTNSISKAISYEYTDDFVEIVPKNTIDFFSAFTTEKDFDRYKFKYKRNVMEKITNGKDLHFRVHSSQPIEIVNKKDFNGWLVVPKLNKWIDFETDVEVKGYKIKRIDDYTVDIVVQGVEADEIEFNSIGDLNVVTEYYEFAIANVTSSYTQNVVESQTQSMVLTIDVFNASILSDIDASIFYNVTTNTSVRDIIDNGTDLSSYISKTIVGSEYIFNATWDAWEITDGNTTEIFKFYWFYNMTNLDSSTYYNFTNATNQTIYNLELNNCSGGGTEIVRFYGKNEEEGQGDIVYTLHLDATITFEDTTTFDQAFDFTGNNTYAICIPINMTSPGDYILDAVMEYSATNVSGNNYVDRKYYIYNLSLNNSGNTINHYLLDTLRSTDVVLTVLDKNTNSPVDDVYIKILRYYPETGQYLTVEVEKTDENGLTLGKMVLADVFYKFILEKDGEILLNTQVQKIISNSKTFGIVVSGDILESWKYVNDIAVDVTCTKSTKVCSYTWSDTNNIVQTALFLVYRMNGYGKILIHNSTSSSSAGTLSYTILGNTSGNTYIAEGYIITNTPLSSYAIDIDSVFYGDTINSIFGVGSLLPIFLLIIVLASAFMDIGAVGVVSGSLIGIIAGTLFGIIPFTITTLTSVIVMGVILIAKLKS